MRVWPIVRALTLYALDWSGWAAFLPTLAILAITSHAFGWPALSVDHEHLLITPEVRIWLTVIAELTSLSMFVLSWRFIEHKTLRDMLLAHSCAMWRPLLVGLFMGASGIALVTLGMMASGCLRLAWGNVVISRHATLSVVGLVISSSLLGPITEEIESRGYLFQNVFRGWGATIATIITALVFAARHLQNPNVSALGIINIALFSIGLTVGMLRLRSLWYTIGWHAAWNFSLVFILGVPTSGYSLTGFDIARASLFSSVSSGKEWLTGGGFGPEGSILATVVILLQIIIMWRIPVKAS